MVNPQIAIIDNFGIVRQSYYLALREMGFEVVIVSHNWKDFADKAAIAAAQPDICLINIDSTIYTDFVNDSNVRSLVKSAGIIGYSLYEELPEIRSSHINVYSLFNTSPGKLRELIFETLNSKRVASDEEYAVTAEA